MHHHRLANRDIELELFQDMIDRALTWRILLIEADGGIGKSTLLAEFVRRCPDDIPCVPVDLKGSPGLHQVLARLCDALGWDHFPSFAAAVERLEDAGAGVAKDQFEHIPLDEYDAAVIRDLLRDAFDVGDLRRLCQVHQPLQPIHRRFTPTGTFEEMIEIVVGYCQRHVMFPELLLAVRQENFRQYQVYYARVYGREAAASRPVRPGAGVGRAEIEAALRWSDEGDRATRRGVLTRALFDDLAAWTGRAAWSERAAGPGRLVLLFDTYEQAGPEVQDWFAGPLLTRARHLASLAVVVAGRQVPEQRIEWAACCHHHALPRLEDPDTWAEYARRNGWELPRPWIEGYCAATRGNPVQMDALLSGAAQWGGG